MNNADTLKIVNDALDAVKLMNREWQGLSDDEIEAVTGEDIRSMYSGTYNSYRAIEQALKEKNT